MPVSSKSLAELTQAFAKRKPGQAASTPAASPAATAPTPADTQGVPGGALNGQDMQQQTPDQGAGSMAFAHDMPPHLSIHAFAGTPQGQAIMKSVIDRMTNSNTADTKKKPLKPARPK